MWNKQPQQIVNWEDRIISDETMADAGVTKRLQRFFILHVNINKDFFSH